MIAEMRNLFFSFQVDVTHLWTAVAAAIVAFSFIFKSAIATMFDSVIFLFVVHAFDVGDNILINGDLHKVSTHADYSKPTTASRLQQADYSRTCLSTAQLHVAMACRDKIWHYINNANKAVFRICQANMWDFECVCSPSVA